MFQNITTKIIGFLVIILALAMSPTIYTANASIVSYNATRLTEMLGMGVIAGFGGFLIIFGLLVSGGMFTLAGVRGQLARAGWGDILKVVGSVIVVIIALTMFLTMLDYVWDLISAATTAGDTIGSTLFGIIPVLVYVGIVAAAGWTQAATYRKLRKGGSGSSKMFA